MDHKQGSDRNQLIMLSLEGAIPKDSFVRVVDTFVNAINLKSFGFAHVECKEEGRPPYHPSILLKLYLYGYHYGIRTTRKLEREAQTNMECEKTTNHRALVWNIEATAGERKILQRIFLFNI